MTEETKFVPAKWDTEIENIEMVLYQAQEMKVTSQEEFNEAADFIKQAQATIKIIEEKRLKYTRPLDEMKDAIMLKKNSIVKPLEQKIDELKRMREAFHRAEQARIAEEQKKIDAEALAKAKENHVAEVVVPVLEVAKTVRTGFSTSTMKKVWLHEIVDKTKVPHEYLVVDEVAVRAAIRKGVRQIEGVRIYEDISDSVL